MCIIIWAMLSPQRILPNLTGDLYCFNWTVGHCSHSYPVRLCVFAGLRLPAPFLAGLVAPDWWTALLLNLSSLLGVQRLPPLRLLTLLTFWQVAL